MRDRIPFQGAVRLLFLSVTALWTGCPCATVRAEGGEEPAIRYAALPHPDRLEGPDEEAAPGGSDKSPGRRGTARASAWSGIQVRPGAPTGCLPADLRIVLADLSARFGGVSVESTLRGRAHNRRAGGARHSLHLSCRAVDVRVRGGRGIMAHLRSRPEVGGLKVYRSGIIHIDDGERRTW